MKKIFNILLLAATALGFTTSCSDVPAPYDIYANGNASYGKTLPYKSASLNTGWTTHTITADEPWSQGSSYTQATGYQDWDGTGSKVNHEVESYLISPALNLKCESGKVKFNFDQTIRYTNNVSGWANNHKIYISHTTWQVLLPTHQRLQQGLQVLIRCTSRVSFPPSKNII